MSLRWILPLLGCGALTSLVASEPTYTITVLPDTQYYYNNYMPGNYAKLLSQVSWIWSNAEADDIRMVLHLGDITQSDNNDVQWTGARAAFDIINGVAPYVIAVGNHDGVDNGRLSYFSKPEYFGVGSPYFQQPTVGGGMDAADLVNSWHFIDTGERTWLVVTLEWGPRDSVMDWLDSLLSSYPDYRTIIVTHAYFFRDSTRLDGTLLGDAMRGSNPKAYPTVGTDPDGCNDGQDIWRKVLKKHPQVALVYSGHVGTVGIGRRMSIGEKRQVIHERLADFQGWRGQGNGWMQTLRLTAAGDLAHVSTFSPYTKESSDAPDLDYDFPFFEDVLPESQLAAVAELDPLYHFELYGWSAMRPIRNRTAHKDYRCLLPSKTVGDSHVFAPGDSVQGTLETPSQDYALATWVRIDASMVDAGTAATIVSLGGLDIRTLPAGDGLHFQLASTASGALIADPAPLLADRWYYLALSQGASGISLYIDGERVGSATTTVDVDPLSQLAIGSADFAGQVHDLSFFNRSLTMADLQRLRLACFTQVQAGQISSGAPATSDDMALPGISRKTDGTGRVNIRRTERSYVRYGSNDVFDQLAWMDDALQYSDGVLLATTVGKMEDTTLPTIGVDRTYRESNTTLGLGTRSGLSLVTLNSGAQSGNRLDVPLAYAFFPTSSGVVSGHLDAGGTLIEETGIARDAAAHVGTQGAIRIASDGFDAGAGLLFANVGSSAAMVVNTGFDSAGNAYLYPLTTYMDHTIQTASGPASFVFIPEDTEGLIGGLVDGASGTALKTMGQASIERESTGVYRITLARDPGPATLLLSSVDTAATAAYGESSDNCLTYEPLGAGRYRVHLYDLPGRTPEDGTFAWAVIPNAHAFGPVDELDAAAAMLNVYVPDADLIGPAWHLSFNWGWIYAAHWPWVWVDQTGWVYFWPTDDANSWVYCLDANEWFGINSQLWPWIYSPRGEWVTRLPGSAE